ncbi:MAG: hypothetical protein ACXWMS_03545 [Syntrophales bacterium]
MEGVFGRANGLLMDGMMLLASIVMIVDKVGVVRYIQIVPEITNLPDMETASRRRKSWPSDTGSPVRQY